VGVVWYYGGYVCGKDGCTDEGKWIDEFRLALEGEVGGRGWGRKEGGPVGGVEGRGQI